LLERAGAFSTARRPAVELVQRFGMPAVIIGLGFFIDGAARELLAGGWLVMQIAAIAMNIDGALRVRALLRPGLAEGRLVVSREYEYRSVAARSVGMAAFCGVVALLFEPGIAAASLLFHGGRLVSPRASIGPEALVEFAAVARECHHERG
jgi:hypothetical protein